MSKNNFFLSITCSFERPYHQILRKEEKKGKGSRIIHLLPSWPHSFLLVWIGYQEQGRNILTRQGNLVRVPSTLSCKTILEIDPWSNYKVAASF
ncbi:conserved hypothetical protein [Ricinus communis]|uniref:Uncharacterized protein n=1 Tax=Ricinus communis TaxID=3988 RepID=B9SHP1_RICCO|nr:conserved hypothetical protein [Ricinus communis]